jgi:hypothetical protein
LVPPMSMTKTFIELHVSSVGEVVGSRREFLWQPLDGPFQTFGRLKLPF